MATSEEIKILIEARNRSNAAFDQAIKNLGKLKEGASGVSSGFKAMLATGAASLASFIAIGKVVGFVRDSLAEFQEGVQAATRLNAVLVATGNTTGFTAAGLGTIADELDRLTAFEDDKIVEAQASLAAFDKVQGDVFKRSMRLGADLTHNFGGELITNIENLGAVLQTPDQGMRRLGIAARLFSEADNQLIKSLTESGQLLQAQDLILARLEGKFGGSASKLDEYTQSVSDFSKEWQRFQEVSGGAMAPGATSILQGLSGGLEATMNWRNKSDSNIVVAGWKKFKAEILEDYAEIKEAGYSLDRSLFDRPFEQEFDARKSADAARDDFDKYFGAMADSASDGIQSVAERTETVLAKMVGDFQGKMSGLLGDAFGKLPGIGGKAGDKWGSFDSGKVSRGVFESSRMPSLAATESRFLTRGRGGQSPEVDAIIKHVGKPVGALAKAVGKIPEAVKRVENVLEQINAKAPTVEIENIGGK